MFEKIKGKFQEINIKQFLYERRYFIIALCVVLAFFGNLVRPEFSRCTFRMYNRDWIQEYKHHLIIGRFGAALWWRFVSEMKFPILIAYRMSYVIGIVSLTIAVYELYKIVKKDVKSNLISFILASSIIMNCFIIDLFIYIEKGIFTASIAFAVLALKFLLKYFDTRKIRYIPVATVLLTLASCCYQGTVALFIGVGAIYILKYTKGIATFIINNIVAAISYGISLGVPYLVMKHFFSGQSTSRTSGKLMIEENLKKVINGMKEITISAYGGLPKKLFLYGIIVMGAFILFGILIYKSRESDGASVYKRIKYKVLFIFGFIYVVSATIITAILPQLAIDTAAVDICARSVYSYGSIMAIAATYFLVVVNDMREFFKYAIGIFLIGFSVISCYETNAMIVDHYSLINIEKQYTMEIGNEIDKYEKETGNKIKYIMFYHDGNSKNTYDDLKSYKDINERIYRTTYSRIEIINYYLGTKFKQKYEVDKDIKAEFEKHDWTTFDDEQLIFDGDTLHLCIY